uniref:Uncharacterized protein n=1 Tax=Opuntia streptacantha TaxID=393608 RepID=A0A7C8ZX50_OPUST
MSRELGSPQAAYLVMLSGKAFQPCKCQITSVTSRFTTRLCHNFTRSRCLHYITFLSGMLSFLARWGFKGTTLLSLTRCFSHFFNFIRPKEHFKCPYIYTN